MKSLSSDSQRTGFPEQVGVSSRDSEVESVPVGEGAQPITELVPPRFRDEFLASEEQLALSGYTAAKRIRANLRKQDSPYSEKFFDAIVDSFRDEASVELRIGRRSVTIEARIEHAHRDRFAVEIIGSDDTEYTLLLTDDYFLLELGNSRYLNETFLPSRCHQIAPLLDRILEGARFQEVNRIWQSWQ